MRVVDKGTYGTHEYNKENELLGGNTRALRGQLQIVVEGRHQRDKALH